MTPVSSRQVLEAMVCGLPSHKRPRLLFCMLASFTDDSGSDKRGPVFILAGYVSTVALWQEFSDAWHAGLQSGPRKLEYFKMQEAAFSGKGQFKKWRRAERDAKVDELARIVKRYAMFGVQAVLWWNDFNAVQARYRKYPIDPYILLFNHVMAAAVTHVRRLQIEEKIEFYFDDQGRTGDIALQAYRIAQARIAAEMLEYVAGPPNHKSDRVVLPLQAADMLAWQSRRFCAENEQHGINRSRYTYRPIVRLLQEIPTERRTLRARNLEAFFTGLTKTFPNGL